ncbi:MAG: GNAT family N-acetyltransferase [Desulfarculaceae bacterium]|nr:GNAT family N-acetyltransferase [Desulfarculaceae bacterium]MCF8074199.1 GNAT family N-acetyltransferase [Desulfarculaceae bacterium]MCF8102780.1 GNAT family N-acetyltransferase [Desulfarculaceae bacterium]MCF8116365.1 GNAT family N-acetyltransferase [Desulfarculaceae bacterium]
MKLPASQSLAIRPMQPTDLDQIVAIDIKVLGQPRPEYWEMKLELVAKRSQMAALVAELEGQVKGFIIGGASRWEYGMPENIGWIDTIGVDPDFQRKGVARQLFEHMTAELKGMGVESLHTFVKRRDWRLLKFFHNMGLKEGDMVNLELDL